MNILILGNGFDLAHGLPTQYKEFLDFIKDVDNPKFASLKILIKDIKIDNYDLYNDINDISSNRLLKYFLDVYEEQCKKGKNGWIDFESEISFIVQTLDKAKQYVVSRTNDPDDRVELDEKIFKILKPFFFFFKMQENGEKFFPRYFDNVANKCLSELNRLIHLLEIYLNNYVGNFDNGLLLPDIIQNEFDHILSFNYTDTYRKFYDTDGKCEYCFIHGKAKSSNKEDCDLVLGIDEYLPPERINDDNQFVWFKKFYQRIYKQTDSTYMDWVNQFKSNDKTSDPSEINLYIYGHSLDVTDKDVLSKLILIPNAKTTIFYHNRDAMAKQISNLIKLIGEDNLIKMTGGTNRAIRFEPSKKAQKTVNTTACNQAAQFKTYDEQL